ncbi:MAG: phosphatidylserine/phosphatidylglycerophosphate/cardiolipin synthase family protein [Acidobacteriota bacterium]|nr:phosphatidylserine/phosphatidylglycerophosphate/cardiolipin synthase family protein [Acidobacteriota bacterium]
MIRDARHFLYLSTYYIEYDTYGSELLAALLEAQRRGVKVNLLIDDFGQRLGGILMAAEDKGRLAAQLDELIAAGAILTRYKPPRLLQRWLGGGQHVKIQVSEAGNAIFGSSNITKSSFDGWNEYSVALRGPIVAILLESYLAIGGVVADAHLSLLSDSVAPTTDPIHLDYWLCNPNTQQGVSGPLGWQEPNVVTERLIEMLETAQENIRLTSFYFKPVESLLHGVIAAASRGVQVEVYHSHRDALPASDLPWIAATARYEQLLDAGVQIYENLSGEHSKIVLIDEDWVAFGSYNFEDAAHDRLAEAMLATHDPQTIAHTISIFDRLKADPSNMSVTKQLLRQLPTQLKLRRALLCPFKRWL